MEKLLDKWNEMSFDSQMNLTGLMLLFGVFVLPVLLGGVALIVFVANGGGR